MSPRTLLAALLVVTPLLAGCFADDESPLQAQRVAASAADAGAVEGEAPSAAKEAYQLQASGGSDAITAYPIPFPTNAPKPPYANEFTGEFQPYQCLPTGGGLPLGGLGFANGGQSFDVSEAFAAGDVFRYDVQLTFTNTDESWAELHLWHQFDGVGNYWSEPTSEGRGEIVLNFTGQGYIVNEEFFAGVGVDCWYGSVTSPIPYRIVVAVTYAEGAVPSQVPVMLPIPEGASRLIVSGLALEGAGAVTSHFRVFAPDDSLVCECALTSADEASVVELPEAGEYVVLVDHTEGGFVAFALDAMPAAPLKPLATRSERFDLAASDGGSLDESMQLDLPSTPLGMWSWVFAPGEWADPPNAGAGHNLKIAVTNARGDVLRMSMVGYFTYHASVPGIFGTNDWYAVPLDGDWEFFQDHHAFDLGGHTVTVKADAIRGRVALFASFYDRGS